MQTVTFDGLKIQKSSKESFYITFNDIVVYIDNSIGENYVSTWLESDSENTFIEKIHTPIN